MNDAPPSPAAPSGSVAKPKIRIEKLHKAFGEKIVLDGVDLEVKEGESLVVIGGSGTGKSVLLKSILGLVTPDSGDIIIDGTSTLSLRGRERDKLMTKFGMLFQGGALFDSLSVWENIAFLPLQQRRMGRAEARTLAIEKLGAVGMPARVADLSPDELSGGMKKRVALARAIAVNPEILFFDEPTTGLDPIMSDVINDLILQCSRDLSLTAVTITHDMHSARKIGNHIAMLHRGRIIWHGPADSIDDSGNPYVDQFIHGHAEGPITTEQGLR